VSKFTAAIVVPRPPVYTLDVRHANPVVWELLALCKGVGIEAGSEIIGDAMAMNFVMTDGEENLLIVGLLYEPKTSFRRRLDGALVGDFTAALSPTGFYPIAIKVYRMERNQ